MLMLLDLEDVPKQPVYVGSAAEQMDVFVLKEAAQVAVPVELTEAAEDTAVSEHWAIALLIMD